MVFSWISLMVWNFFPFNGDFSLGKSQKSHGTKSGPQRGWVTWVIWCFAKKLYTRCSAWVGTLLWWSCQSPVASFWIVQIVSAEECSSLVQNLMQIHCSTCSVILNVTVTQYTCSLNGVCHPHWLVQWSRHCSLMHIPAHSPWLPGYADVTQTILIILTTVGLFPDRPSIL